MMTLDKVLRNIVKLDDATEPPRRNNKTFYKHAKMWNWIIVEDLGQRIDKVKCLLEKIGFVQEEGTNNYWYYSKQNDMTYRVFVGFWENKQYGNFSGRCTVESYKGKRKFRSPRIGDRYRDENGRLVTITKHGHWTGD